MGHNRDFDGFLFNVEKWRGSRPIQRMSFLERGVYLEMMLECWLHKRLPDDPQAVADLIATTPEQAQHVLDSWPIVRRSFATCESSPQHLEHLTLERTRRDQRKYRRTKSVNGKAGGDAAARNRRERQALNTVAESSAATAHSSDPNGMEEKRVEEIKDKPPPTMETADFQTFSAAYPASRRVGGKIARKAFHDSGIGRHGESLASVLLTLEQHKRSEQWQTPKLIPLMTTWLNQERWLQSLPESTTRIGIRTTDRGEYDGPL